MGFVSFFSCRQWLLLSEINRVSRVSGTRLKGKVGEETWATTIGVNTANRAVVEVPHRQDGPRGEHHFSLWEKGIKQLPEVFTRL